MLRRYTLLLEGKKKDTNLFIQLFEEMKEESPFIGQETNTLAHTSATQTIDKEKLQLLTDTTHSLKAQTNTFEHTCIMKYAQKKTGQQK